MYDGGARTEAAKIGRVGLQTVRDGVLAFNAEGPSGLVDGKAPGNPSLLNDDLRQALTKVVESGPDPVIHGVVRWCLIDLAQWVFVEFHIPISKHTLGNTLRGPGFRKLSPCPWYRAQDAEALETFMKNFVASQEEVAKRVAAGKSIEIRFQDEARIGRKNKSTRRGAKRSTRPSTLHDQRTRSTYIFGTICPKRDVGAGLILPRCNAGAMALHLE